MHAAAIVRPIAKPTILSNGFVFTKTHASVPELRTV
jgi:hypothetical protein